MRRFGWMFYGVLLACLAAGCANASAPTDSSPAGAAPAERLEDITVRVTDSETGQPVKECQGSVDVRTAGVRQVEWEPSGYEQHWADGVCTIKAPLVCLVTVLANVPGYTCDPLFNETAYVVAPQEYWDDPSPRTTPITWAPYRAPYSRDSSGTLAGRPSPSSPTNFPVAGPLVTDRHIEVSVTRGRRLRGVVRDAETGLPIQGVHVGPKTNPWTVSLYDPDRWVTTDADGRYEIDGLDSSRNISVWHPLYERWESWDGWRLLLGPGKTAEVADISLQPLPSVAVQGRVTDAGGHGIEGAQIEDMTTDKEGAFAGRLPVRPSQKCFLLTKKEGLLPQATEVRTDRDIHGLQIVLQPELTLAAQVVDHEGRPVPAFTFKIVYGALPERLYRFETMEVQDAEGRFAVPIGTDDPFPVAMAAPGYAPSARVVQVTPDAEPLVFTLDRGVAVDGVFEGTVRKPGGLDVLMELKEGRYGCELFDVRTRADERGAFRLEHVAPGKYVFLASGLGISPIVREVDVGTEDVHLGSLEYKGSGRISGVVHIFRSEPWRFASGTMWNEASGEEFWFRADARGRFEVDNVPVGTVQIVCMWGVTDLPSAATATVEVVEGQTSTAVVRFSRDD